MKKTWKIKKRSNFYRFIHAFCVFSFSFFLSSPFEKQEKHHNSIANGKTACCVFIVKHQNSIENRKKVCCVFVGRCRNSIANGLGKGKIKTRVEILGFPFSL